MKTIVMKFGGTSVENAGRILNSAKIVAQEARKNRVVVVASALAGVTDQILKCTNAAARTDEETLRACLETIRARHEEMVAELFPEPQRGQVLVGIQAILQRLHDFCFALLQLRAITPQLLDVSLGMGEKMSNQIFAALLQHMGHTSMYVDSVDVLVTDDRFGDATADLEATRLKAEEILVPHLKNNCIPVVTGYAGATPKGQPTTLGRGGSDSSATIIGSVLNCDEIWIWTDVDGVLTADPRLGVKARILPEVTFAEAIELSYYGAKVIHHKAIRPAMEKNIPVWIKNSFKPEVAGTKITAHASTTQGPIKGVSAITKASLITLSVRDDIYAAADILGRLFLRLGHDHVDILFSTQSSAENAFGLVLRGEDTDRVRTFIERIFRTELKHGVLKSVKVEKDLAVIAILGEAMKGSYGIIARLFAAVARCKVSVIAVAQGATELSICFAVQASSASEVIRAIHKEFLE